MLGYAKEALDRPGAQLRGILAEKTIIACRDILAEAYRLASMKLTEKGLWHLRQIAVYQSFVKTERRLLKI